MKIVFIMWRNYCKLFLLVLFREIISFLTNRECVPMLYTLYSSHEVPFNHESVHESSSSAYGEAAPSAKSLCAHFDPVCISLFPHLSRW